MYGPLILLVHSAIIVRCYQSIALDCICIMELTIQAFSIMTVALINIFEVFSRIYLEPYGFNAFTPNSASRELGLSLSGKGTMSSLFFISPD